MPTTESNGRVHYGYHEAEPTAETLEHWNGMVDAARALFPLMLVAKQPPQLPKGLHCPLTGPAIRERFQRTVTDMVASNTYRLRLPALTADGCYEKQVNGDCIAPALVSGDVFLLDPNVEPQEGDIVSILVHPATMQDNLNWRLQYPEHVATYGEHGSVFIMKILAAFGSKWYGINNGGGAFELGERTGNRVCGVVRAIARHGTLTYPGGRKKSAWVRMFENSSPPMREASALLAHHATVSAPYGPVSCRALGGMENLTANLSSLTGISTSSPEFDALDVTRTDPCTTMSIVVTGRVKRTAGSGTDSLIASLSKTGGGSFNGLTTSTWTTSTNGSESTFAISCTFTATGNGPWTIILDLFTGGGLATFSVSDVALLVTADETP
jgi:hypothetical protein